jgi:GT2 family glycosyltransferase
MPEIIGLILNYRDAPRTLRCVSSLLADGAAAVVVLDNSADDGESASRLLRALDGDSRVSVLESRINLGFAAGVNSGIERIRQHAPEAWILLLNNDATVRTGALAALSSALQDDPDAVLAYPWIDHGGHVRAEAYYQPWLGLVTRRPLPGAVPHASGCAVLFAPQRWGEALYDEAFFMYGEDAELGFRLRRRKRRMVRVEHALVDHEGSASSGLGSEFYESRMVAAHWLLARRLASSVLQRNVMYAARFAFLGARAMLRSLRFRSLVPIRALVSGWRLAHGRDPLQEFASRERSRHRRLGA